jgi:hypothetical protein
MRVGIEGGKQMEKGSWENRKGRENQEARIDLNKTSFVQEGDAERASVWWVLLVLDKLNIGYYNPHTK